MAASPEVPERRTLYAAHLAAQVERTEAALARSGHDRLLLHSGRPKPRFQDDYVPPFRAHPHFVSWLPLPRNPDCLLEVRPGRRPRLWLVAPDDFWHAPPAAPAAWWAGHFDIETVADAEGWQHTLEASMATALIGEPGDFRTLGDHAELNPPALLRELDELRTVKTDWQIACMAAANRAAAAGHRAAEAAFRDGASELDIHLAYLRAADHDPDRLPYGSIVALNEHAAVLHYQYREVDAPDESRSFLIDAGADCHGYAADVTRTYAGGDAEFGDLIDAVDDMQQRLAARMQAGRSYVDLNDEAHRGVAEILRSFGLCDMTLDAIREAGVTSTFLPHGLGHFIGAQVHDVAGRVGPDGQPLPPPDAHRALRLTRVLEAGNVVTVEPGLYFIPSLLEQLKRSPVSAHFDWKRIERLQRFGGIRIEDDVAVRADGADNLTRQAWADTAR